jgi:hypothetical protein
MLEAAKARKNWLKVNLGITLSDSLFVQRLESTNCGWTYVDLPAKLPADCSKPVRMSSRGVCLITR